MDTYHHFSIIEREEISRGLAQGLSFRAIALTLGRSPSSVSREVHRHFANIGYRACRAQFRARKRSRKPRRLRFTILHSELWDLIQTKLRLQWSPEQVSVWLRSTYAASHMRVSHEAIYQALYVLPRGTLRKELLRCLRRHHKRRKRMGKILLSDRRGQIANMTSIHDRPADIEPRIIPGHWEGDFLMGKRMQSAIGTLVERTTRYVLLCHLSSPTPSEAWKAFARRLRTVPEPLRTTLTYDQGKEMSYHQKLTKAVKVKVFFCDPHSPWQRGTNENTNGLLRQYFPKGTDFTAVTTKQLRLIEERLNGRPRKTLQWRKPHEAFTSCLSVALRS